VETLDVTTVTRQTKEQSRHELFAVVFFVRVTPMAEKGLFGNLGVQELFFFCIILIGGMHAARLQSSLYNLLKIS
jgi:hypothetical protein